MWKLVFWARSALPTEEFQHRWRTEHGPLIAGHAERLGLHKYIQNHRMLGQLDEAERSERPTHDSEVPSIDIVDEWFFHSRAHVEESLASEHGRAAWAEIVASERRILDLSRCQLHHIYEFPQINPTPETIVASEKNRIIKTVAMALPHPNDTRTLDIAHWLTHHTPIVRRVAPVLGILRYVGNHPLTLLRPSPNEDPLVGALRDMRDSMCIGVPDFPGMSCEWQDIEDARRWTTDPEKIAARREIFDDEDDLVGEGVFIIAKEHVLVDHYRH